MVEIRQFLAGRKIPYLENTTFFLLLPLFPFISPKTR